jgi:hypothetical protein
MKECRRCGLLKPPEEFSARRYKKQPWCKECNRAYAQQYYQANKPKLKAELIKLRTERQKQNEQFILDYLAAHPCVDCGETDPVVLEFDHVRGVKRDIISTLVRLGYTHKTLIAEIEKCDVVCANCHRRRTAQIGNFYKVRNRLTSD